MDKGTAYFFDVDGVLTDPFKKIIPEKLINQLRLRLEKNFVVGINTGRSNVWLKTRLIKPLLAKIKDKEKLFRLMVAGEKGGTWIFFEKDGTMKEGKKEIIVSQKLIEAVRKMVDEKYNHLMFLDTTKETMISIEMQDGASHSEFLTAQKELLIDLERLLITTEKQNAFKIAPSSIATDIERVGVGKDLGAKLLLELLAKKELQPQRFVVFGDNKSDFAAADELKTRELEVSFVYTGNKKMDLEVDYPMVSAGGYSQGTLEYLEKEPMG